MLCQDQDLVYDDKKLMTFYEFELVVNDFNFMLQQKIDFWTL